MDFTKLISRKIVLGEAAGRQERVFHISLGISRDYVAQAGVLMTSIVRHNSGTALSFHVFCDVIDETDLQRMETLAEQEKDIAITIYCINKAEMSHMQSSLRYPVAIFYRLISAALLKQSAERLLYLDSDMLCMGSLQQLDAASFDGICMAAKDSGDWIPLHKQEIGLPSDHDYFNSGVLYIDLQQWNEARISERAIELLAERSFSFPDQDALNILIGERYQPLPEKYNFFCSKCTEADLPQDTVFLHYAGDIKPWHPWCKSGLKERWEKGLRESLWQGYRYLPRNYQENRLMGRVARKQGHYRKALVWYWRYVADKIKFKKEKLKK